MKIAEVVKEDTAYDKWIRFEHEGQEYSVLLHWDKWDGFDITFTELDFTRRWIDAPDWAVTWDEEHEESLGYTLELLSDETLEGAKL